MAAYPAVVVRPVREADKEAVIRVLTDAFINDSIYLHVPMKTEDFETFVRLHWTILLADQLSLLVETEDHRVVACVAAYDFATPSPPELVACGSTAEYIRDVIPLLQRLQEHYAKDQGFAVDGAPRGHTAYISFMATERDFRGRGIASALTSHALELYKEKGFRFAMAEAVSPRSQIVCERHGFRVPLKILYEEFFPKGSVFLKQVADGNKEAHLVVKEL